MSDIAYGTSGHYLGEKGEEYFAWQSAGGEFGARISAHAFRDKIRADMCVVDFGCGGGFLLRELNPSRGIGVEINPVARAFAVSKDTECYENLNDVADGVADIVISNHALEHVPYPLGALAEMRRVLKPGGLFLLCVPIDNWRHQKRFDPNDKNHHLHTWTPQLLGNTLIDAGYDVINIFARIHAWPGRWTVACYGRLPYWMFRQVCFWYGFATGKGWEIIAEAKPRN